MARSIAHRPGFCQTRSSHEVRLAARENKHTTGTSGISAGYLQANLIVLPSRYAADFRTLCRRNPVPCPLIAESACLGSFDAIKSHIDGLANEDILASGCDLRRDIPRYMVYQDSKVAKSHCKDITDEWTDDHIAFLIGCSFSFESDLAANGLPPRNVTLNRGVSMYRTALPLCPAGVFLCGTYVVSMRPYKKKDIERVREITRRFGVTHGEPIDWGWEALDRLGIRNIDKPEWGDMTLSEDGQPFGRLSRHGGDDDEVPVFWGCGVTPQDAVMSARLEGTVMAHAPGHMLILDVRDVDVRDEGSL